MPLILSAHTCTPLVFTNAPGVEAAAEAGEVVMAATAAEVEAEAGAVAAAAAAAGAVAGAVADV